MPHWRERNSYAQSNASAPPQREPRNLTERADLIMRMLEAKPLEPTAMPDQGIAAMGPVFGASYQAQDKSFGAQMPGIEVSPDGRPAQLASGATALQIGSAGIAALRALGAAAAAALATILQSYRNRLGRLPNPDELDAELIERAKQQAAPTAPPSPPIQQPSGAAGGKDDGVPRGPFGYINPNATPNDAANENSDAPYRNPICRLQRQYIIGPVPAGTIPGIDYDQTKRLCEYRCPSGRILHIPHTSHYTQCPSTAEDL